MLSRCAAIFTSEGFVVSIFQQRDSESQPLVYDKMVCDTLMVNPFKQSGISHSGHLDMFISIFMVVQWYFSFFDQILMELSVIKQWRP